MQIFKIIAALNKMAEIRDKPAPIKFTYAVAKNIQTLSEAAQIYEEKRVALVRKYAWCDATGAPIKGSVVDGKFVQGPGDSVHIQDLQCFNAEHNTLLSEELPVTLLRVHIDHWPEKMDPATMMAILPMMATD